MNKNNDQKSEERVAFSLFHAAVEREKEQTENEPVKKSDEEKELDNRG